MFLDAKIGKVECTSWNEGLSSYTGCPLKKRDKFKILNIFNFILKCTSL
jgi:hypothetical protein